MTFQISIKVGWKTYHLTVERLYINDRIELYKVTGGNKSIVIQSNRPFFRSKGLKHRKGTWKVIDGKAQNNQAYQAVIDAILKVVDKT